MDFSAPIDITPYRTSEPITQSPNQCSFTNTASQINYLGIFLLFLIVGCLWVTRWHRRQHKRPEEESRHQQIEQLERIWKMTTHQEP